MTPCAVAFGRSPPLFTSRCCALHCVVDTRICACTHVYSRLHASKRVQGTHLLKSPSIFELPCASMCSYAPEQDSTRVCASLRVGLHLSRGIARLRADLRVHVHLRAHGFVSSYPPPCRSMFVFMRRRSPSRTIVLSRAKSCVSARFCAF